MKNRFDNRTILVTGAGSGMGRETALRLAEEGANVVLWGRREEPLRAVANEIERHGSSALVQICDISDSEKIGIALEKAVGQFGHLDGVFANAGHLGEFKPLRDTVPADFESLTAINLVGTQQVIAQSLKYMTGGSILINASWTASAVMPGSGAYAATKAALVAMMRVWACEEGPSEVRINTISPGIILTAMAEEVLDSAISAQLSDHTPLRRNGRPEDVCATVAWLLSDDSSFVTGQNITVDGGFSIGGALR